MVTGTRCSSISFANRAAAEIDGYVGIRPTFGAFAFDFGVVDYANPVTELLSSTPEAVAARVASCHEQAGRRFIVGAGCEVPAATPHKNVAAMVAYAVATRP